MNVKSLQDVETVRPVISEEQAGIEVYSFSCWPIKDGFEHGQKLLSFTKSVPTG